MENETIGVKQEVKVECDHKAPYVGIGQSVVNLGGGILVVTSTACSKCGKGFNVEITQVPIKVQKENKPDIMVPMSKSPILKR